MGFNIAGLVIDQNFDKDINKLGEALNWNLQVVEEIQFETASANWTPEDEFNVYFSEKATMVFFSHELAMQKYHVQGSNSLCYAYSATSMAFLVSYRKRDGTYRFFIEYEGDAKLQEGEALDLEEDYPTGDALIFKLIDDLLGEPFGSIDLGAKAFRCKIAPEIEASYPIEKKATTPPPKNNVQIPQRKSWWQFWK